MKRTLLYLTLLFFISTICLGQESKLRGKRDYKTTNQKVTKEHQHFGPQQEFGTNDFCRAMEMDARLRAKYPELGSLEDFETQFQKDITNYQIRHANAR